jgi:hypothetical protein
MIAIKEMAGPFICDAILKRKCDELEHLAHKDMPVNRAALDGSAQLPQRIEDVGYWFICYRFGLCSLCRALGKGRSGLHLSDKSQSSTPTLKNHHEILIFKHIESHGSFS